MSHLIDKPGIYDISADNYHADPCKVPSLSSSIAKIMVGETPLHAYRQHPRLNPAFEREEKAQFDLGRTAHDMLLREPDNFVIVDEDAWRTNAAKAAREEAYEAGKTPLLRKQYDEVSAMVETGRAVLRSHELGAYFFDENAHTEQTIVWEEDGVWFRIRLDRASENHRLLFDYKTTAASAHPDQWGRKSLYTLGYDIQLALYKRGVQAVLGVEPDFFFLVQETKPPYALCVQTQTPMGEQIGQAKIERAVAYWRWCMERQVWPAYPNNVAYVEPPGWEAQHWLEENTDHSNHTDEMKRLMQEWQAPLETDGATS